MKRGTPRHPKLRHLCELLEIPVPTAVGHLEMLWHFVSEFCPRGDVGKYADAQIEQAVDWTGARGRLVAALIEAGWMDTDPVHRLLIHDWADHADDAVRKKLSRSGFSFLSASEVTGQRQTTAADVRQPSGQRQPSLEAMADNGCLPEPSLAACQSHTPEPLPEPDRVLADAQPEPETEPRLRARRPATVAEIDGATSPGFEPWWDRWRQITGLAQHKDEAARAWLSVAKRGDEPKIDACLERYAQSDQVSRGVITNPDRWLYEQARNGWTGDWPRCRSSGAGTRQQQNADAWRSA